MKLWLTVFLLCFFYATIGCTDKHPNRANRSRQILRGSIKSGDTLITKVDIALLTFENSAPVDKNKKNENNIIVEVPLLTFEGQ